MNNSKKLLSLLAFFLLIGLIGCKDDNDNNDPEPEPEPEPVSITLTLTAATLDGEAIDPTPDYTITVNFDKDGNPDGYTASGDATYQPSIGTSGTFSITGTEVTFTSGDDSRTATITSGELNNETSTISLQWDLSKIDDGVPPDEAGTYIYELAI